MLTEDEIVDAGLFPSGPNSDDLIAQFTGMMLSAGGTDVATAAYGYDDANRLTSLTYTHGGSTLESYGYTYDANNWITQITDNDGTTNYTYNNDGELTGASGSGLPSSNSYSYDANGNRTDTGDTTGINNELTSDGTYDYAYDANGNLITQTTIATGATENFTWDYRNRLTEVTFKNSSGVTTETIQYTYDAFNQRLSQTVKNGSGTVTLAENYVYDPAGDLVMVLNASGAITHTFLNGPNGQNLADDAGSGNVTWLLADQQGSVRDVIDDSGAVVDHIVYDSYGNILSQTSSENQPRFAYAGMQLDAAMGLYYDHARYYDAGTGTFISQDPIGFAGGTADLYDYVRNDPINFSDVTGMIPEAIVVAEMRQQQDSDPYPPNFNVQFPSSFNNLSLAQLQQLKDEAYNRWKYYQRQADLPTAPPAIVSAAACWQSTFQNVDDQINDLNDNVQAVRRFVLKNTPTYGQPFSTPTISADGTTQGEAINTYTVARPLPQLANDIDATLMGAPTIAGSGPQDDSNAADPAVVNGNPEERAQATKESVEDAGKSVIDQILNGVNAVNVVTWTLGNSSGVYVVNPQTGEIYTSSQGTYILQNYAGSTLKQ